MYYPCLNFVRLTISSSFFLNVKIFLIAKTEDDRRFSTLCSLSQLIIEIYSFCTLTKKFSPDKRIDIFLFHSTTSNLLHFFFVLKKERKNSIKPAFSVGVFRLWCNNVCDDDNQYDLIRPNHWIPVFSLFSLQSSSFFFFWYLSTKT